MKQMNLFLIAVLTISTITSCSKGLAPKGPEAQAEQKPILISATIANNITDFSFNFMKNLQTETPVADNIFVSPLSLHMALGMLANGATAETKAEIMKALKTENLSQTELNETYLKLLKELPVADPKVKLALANSIWHKKDFAVEQSFLTNMKNYFSAAVLPLTTVTPVNQWASDNTNGKITKVLDKIDPDLVMLIMNALYFKGNWTSQFKTADTRDQQFKLQGGGVKAVKMMNQQNSFEYASFTDYDVLRMPYGNGQFVATFILPKGSRTIAEVYTSFDELKWEALQNNLKKQTVIVGIPKFTFSQEFNLNATLKKMGMVRAFTPGAQLDGIHKTAPLMVSFVKQNTFVGVDEVGTEAAAVTTIGIVLTSLPSYPSFICDKPFGFIISEKTSNTILFMGKIMSPDN